MTVKSIAERVSGYETSRECPVDSKSDWLIQYDLNRAHAEEFEELVGKFECLVISLATPVPKPNESFPYAGLVVEAYDWPESFIAPKTWGEFMLAVDKMMVTYDRHHVFIEDISVSTIEGKKIVVVSTGS